MYTFVKHFVFFLLSLCSLGQVAFAEDSVYLGPIVTCRECMSRKFIPYDKCELIDNFLQPVGLIVSGSPVKKTYIRCESLEYRTSVFIPVTSQMISVGLLARFEFPTGVGAAEFADSTLDDKHLPDLFGQYTGFIGGLTAVIGGSGGIYVKDGINLTSSSFNVAFGFELAAGMIFINPYSPDSDGGHCSGSCITAIRGTDQASLDHFDPAHYKDWKFLYMGSKDKACGPNLAQKAE